MTPELFRAVELRKVYGSRVVVDALDLAIAPGEVLALIGPNGAGKSTTVEMLIGLRIPDGGEVRYALERPRAHTGVQLQSAPLFPGLSTADNLRLFAAFYGRALTVADLGVLLARAGLTAVAKVEAARLSGGQQKRLAIAAALVHDPALVFLEEPTAALDPRAQAEVRAMIAALATTGTAVLLTSHDMAEVTKLANRVVVLIDGRVAAEGTPAALCRAADVPDLDALYLRLTEAEAVARITQSSYARCSRAPHVTGCRWGGQSSSRSS